MRFVTLASIVFITAILLISGNVLLLRYISDSFKQGLKREKVNIRSAWKVAYTPAQTSG